MNKYLIIIPTFNEKDNISTVLTQIINLNNDFDILVVDDNSPDGTSDIVEEFILLNSNINIIKRKNKGGLGSAYIDGFKWSINNNYNYVMQIDADLSHNPNDIKRFIPLLDKYDFVIGSRYMKGGKCSMKFSRFVLSYFGNLFIKILLKTKINEHTTSFRGFNLAKLNKKKIDLKKINASGYSFFMETIYHLKKKKCSIKEIPITFRDRKFGKSKIPKLEILRTLTNLFKLKFFSDFK